MRPAILSFVERLLLSEVNFAHDRVIGVLCRRFQGIIFLCRVISHLQTAVCEYPHHAPPRDDGLGLQAQKEEVLHRSEESSRVHFVAI